MAYVHVPVYVWFWIHVLSDRGIIHCVSVCILRTTPYTVLCCLLTIIGYSFLCTFQAELKGKKGIVPHNFLEEFTADRMNSDKAGIEMFQ